MVMVYVSFIIRPLKREFWGIEEKMYLRMNKFSANFSRWKKERARVLRRVMWSFSKFFIFLCKRLSLNSIYRLGGNIGKLVYYMAFSHRKIALDSFNNIEIEGREFLNKALEKNQGVIALSAHFGNFPLISLKLAREGYKINVVARPMRDGDVEDYAQDLRTKAGVNTIYSLPRGQCVANMIKSLRNNEIVIIHMDQNFGTTGVWVKFFGRLAATPVGPVVLALRTNAPILPMFIIREGIGKHRLKILPELKLDYFPERGKTVLINTIKITKLTEEWVKRYPELWGWIHKRWKSRPSEEVIKEKFRIQTDEIDEELPSIEGYVKDLR